jgi:hypothetical protein
VVVNYGYMEQPDVRKILKDMQRQKLFPVAADRWIMEVGEEDIVVDSSLGLLKRIAVCLFSPPDRAPRLNQHHSLTTLAFTVRQANYG